MTLSPHLIRELFIAVWKRQHWPQQAMSYERWDELASLAAAGSETSKCIFPGGIVACRDGDQLALLAGVAD